MTDEQMFKMDKMIAAVLRTQKDAKGDAKRMQQARSVLFRVCLRVLSTDRSLDCARTREGILELDWHVFDGPFFAAQCRQMLCSSQSRLCWLSLTTYSSAVSSSHKRPLPFSIIEQSRFTNQFAAAELADLQAPSPGPAGHVLQGCSWQPPGGPACSPARGCHGIRREAERLEKPRRAAQKRHLQALQVRMASF